MLVQEDSAATKAKDTASKDQPTTPVVTGQTAEPAVGTDANTSSTPESEKQAEMPVVGNLSNPQSGQAVKLEKQQKAPKRWVISEVQTTNDAILFEEGSTIKK